MNHVAMPGIRYIGLDIIDEVIESNRRKYGRADREFAVADVTTDPLPKADLMLCRDCTFHLPFANVWQILQNFVRSGTPLMLLTHHNNNGNVDLEVPGGYQSRDFLREPFLLPRPPEENWLADFPEDKGRRFLCLWTVQDIDGALERARREGRLTSPG
jgi:hypothetical protein